MAIVSPFSMGMILVGSPGRLGLADWLWAVEFVWRVKSTKPFN